MCFAVEGIVFKDMSFRPPAPCPLPPRHTLKQVLAAGQSTGPPAGRPPPPGSRRAQKEARDRGAPPYAGRKAEAEGVLDQQDVINLVATQLIKNGVDEPSTLCQVLPNWCALQKIPCSDFVYKVACQALGFVGEGAANMRDYWLAGTQMQGPAPPNSNVRNVALGLPNEAGPWEQAFRKVCYLMARDPYRHLVQFYAQGCRGIVDREKREQNKLWTELWDIARHGYVPGSENPNAPYGPAKLAYLRDLTQHLAIALLGPFRDGLMGTPGSVLVFASSAEPLYQEAADALVRAARTADVNDIHRAMHTMLQRLPCTANIYVPVVLESGTRHISLDAALLQLHSSGGLDVAVGDGTRIPNTAIDAVISHPSYDPRKCVNFDGRTLLSTILGTYFGPAIGMPNIDPAVRSLTLRRILAVPNQNFRQKRKGAGLVHQCLTLKIENITNPGGNHLQSQIKAWEMRKEALYILYEATRTQRDEIIWRWSDALGRSPRWRFQRAWTVWQQQALQLMPTLLNPESNLRDRVVSLERQLEDLFLVAERGL